MKLAYIISAYKYPEQLARLVFRLHTGETSFFIHVDKKTDNANYSRMIAMLGALPNIYFLKRHVCYWGDFGHVQATIEGIDEIIRRDIEFDYVFLLTGQDYPIKSNDQIKTFLQKSGNSMFINYFPLPCNQWASGGLNRIQKWHFRAFGRLFAFPPDIKLFHRFFSIRRKFPEGFKPFGGSSYFCLTRDCIRHVYRIVQQNRQFVKFFKYVYIPDEIFFQTIIINSAFKAQVINDDLRYIDWSRPHPPYPAILRTSDFDVLLHSTKLFARKFDSSIDANILDLIDRKILTS